MLVIESQNQPKDLDIITTCKLFLIDHDMKDWPLWHSGTPEDIAMML